MKPILLALLVLLPRLLALAEASAMDRPAHIKGMHDLQYLAKSLKEEITEEQGQELSDAVSFIGLSLSSLIRPASDATEKDRVAASLFDGRTPREIVLWSQYCMAIYHSSYSAGITHGAKIKPEDSASDAGHAADQAYQASERMRFYLMKANQALLPTSTVVTPPAGQEPRRP